MSTAGGRVGRRTHHQARGGEARRNRNLHTTAVETVSPYLFRRARVSPSSTHLECLGVSHESAHNQANERDSLHRPHATQRNLCRTSEGPHVSSTERSRFLPYQDPVGLVVAG